MTIGPTHEQDPAAGADARGRGRGNLALLWLAATLPTAAALVYFVLLRHHPAAPLVYAASKVVQFLLPVAALAAVASRGLRRRAAAVRRRGIRSNGANGGPIVTSTGTQGSALVAGVAAGIVLSAGALVTRLLLSSDPALAEVGRAVEQRIASYSLTEPARYLAFALFLSFAHSALEECYWRWFLLGGLMQRGSAKARAILLSSVAFTAHHVVVVSGFVPRERWLLLVLGSFGVLVAGLVWSWLFLRWRSILSPWVSHALVDLMVLALGWDLLGRAHAPGP